MPNIPEVAQPFEEKAEVSAETKDATFKLAQSVARSLDENPNFSAVAKAFDLLFQKSFLV